MTLPDSLDASTGLLLHLANPAGRALALACVASLALAAFRVKTTSVRLLAWTAVLYAALAMPLLGWMLPGLSFPTPAFLQFRANPPAVGSPAALQPAATAVVRSRASFAFIARNATVKGTSSGKIDLLVSPQSVEPRPTPLPGQTVPAAVALSDSQPNPAGAIRWDAVAAGIYFVVALLLLARFMVGITLGRRLIGASQILRDPRFELALVSRAYAAGLAVVPQAAESEFISAPVTMGALRSTILLPADWREWDDRKLDAVVAHEVSHVARRDGLTQRISLLHRAIFWFSPLAWWLDRHLADLAEQASDEAVLSCGADRTDYAKTLLGFFEALEAAPGRVWWQGVSMAKAGQAEERVDRILAWKGAVAMGVKKSIMAVVVAVAVPVVYLAASVHPANYNVGQHGVYLAQEQAPPVPAPKARPMDVPPPAQLPDRSPAPDVAPATHPAPASDAVPPPALAPPAIGWPEAAPEIAPVAGIPAIAGVGAYAPVGVIVPRTPLAMPVPLRAPVRATGWAQSQSSGSSSANGYSYSYGYDGGQRFVIVSGNSDSFTMSGDSDDIAHAKELRKKIQGDFIWFQNDEKSYIIRDQTLIDNAKKLWAPQEELGKKQEALGKQQEALGERQEALGKKMEEVRVNVPDMTEQLDKLKAELKKLGEGGTQEQLGDLQAEIGELQSKIGELQSQAGEKQGELGRQQGELGRQQGELGRQQGRLGETQGNLARQATQQMKDLLKEALASGKAQPEP